MNSIDTQRTPSRGGRRIDPAARAKSVLFCPFCGYESAIDEDWLVTDVDEASGASDGTVGTDAETVGADAEAADRFEPIDGERREFVCPDCGAVVTVR